jgi:hypothetical protein
MHRAVRQLRGHDLLLATVRRCVRCRRPGRGGRGVGRRCRVGLGGEQPGVQAPQFGPGLHPEFVDQSAADLLVRRQRVGLPSGPVQRQHEQPVQGFAKRVLDGQLLEFADDVPVPAQLQVEFQPLLEGGEAAFGEPVPFGVQQRAGQTVAERAAPQRQRRVQRLGGAGQVAGGSGAAGPVYRPLEVVQVQTARRDGEQVSAVGPGEQRGRGAPGAARLQHPAQRRHVFLHQVDRVRGCGLTPHLVDQPFPAHRLVGLQQQHREQHPGLHRPRVEHVAGDPGAKRPEHLEADLRVDVDGHRRSPAAASPVAGPACRPAPSGL